MSLIHTLTTWNHKTTANTETPVASARLSLVKGEVMSVKIVPHQARVHVLTGHAWISYEHEDYFLSYGEEITLPPSKFDAIITALYDKPLMFELLPSRA